MPVAIVTGGARGIGKAVCEALLHKGYSVGVLDVNEALGAETAGALAAKYGSGHVMFQKCDVTDGRQLTRAFQAIPAHFGGSQGEGAVGGLWLVVNNAAVMDEVGWERMVDVNLSGVIRGTYIAVQCMSKANGGQGGTVINVASKAGLTPFLFQVYSTTKHGVVGFTKSFGEIPGFVKTHGVRVNCICPDGVDTPFLPDHFHDHARLGSRLDEPMDLHVKETVFKFALENNISPLLTPEQMAQILVKVVEDKEAHGAAFYVDDDGQLKIHQNELKSASQLLDLEAILEMATTSKM